MTPDRPDVSMPAAPDPDSVVLSYVRPSEPVRVHHLLTPAQAREFWARLSEPLRASASIRQAGLEDFDREDCRWEEPLHGR